MNDKNVENRLNSLEEQVQNILSALQNGQRTQAAVKDWRKSLGMFDDDSLMKEIDSAGQNIRKHEREQVSDDHS